jgi:predicted RNA methylase
VALDVRQRLHSGPGRVTACSVANAFTRERTAMQPAPTRTLTAAPAAAAQHETSDGFVLARPLLLPDARRFEELFDYHGEWQTPTDNGQVAACARTLPAPCGKANTLGPYCTIDLHEGGLGPAHRAIIVRANDAVVNALAESIVVGDDTLCFQIIAHSDTDRALVVVRHNRIIGSRWLAYIDPATIPPYPYCKRDQRVDALYAALELRARRPTVHRHPDGSIQLHTEPPALTPIIVSPDGSLARETRPSRAKQGGKAAAPMLFDTDADAPRDSAPPAKARRRVRKTAIAPAALEVLACCTTTGDAVILPEALERSTYDAVNRTLIALGGRWNRKRKAHVFAPDRPVAELLAAALASGATERTLTGYFPTPLPLARQLVALADVRAEHLVLEPSAGRGAIASVLTQIVAAEQLYLVELDGANHPTLEQAGFKAPQLIAGDFLTTRELPGEFDRIVMNPPFEDQQDVRHVLRAYELLAGGGRLAAIMSASLDFRDTKPARQLRELIDACPTATITENPRDAFKESGAAVESVIVTLTKQ